MFLERFVWLTSRASGTVVVREKVGYCGIEMFYRKVAFIIERIFGLEDLAIRVFDCHMLWTG
jgi:hypothetical protein